MRCFTESAVRFLLPSRTREVSPISAFASAINPLGDSPAREPTFFGNCVVIFLAAYAERRSFGPNSHANRNLCRPRHPCDAAGAAVVRIHRGARAEFSETGSVGRR